MGKMYDHADYGAGKYISAVFLSIVEHPIIRYFILLIVLLNCVVIGVQTNLVIAKKYATVFLRLEQAIFIILAMEISSKMIFCFRTFWMRRRNIVGLLILILTMAAYRFLPPSQKSFIKIARLLRSVKLFSFFQFPKMLNNIRRAIYTLVNILLLIASFMMMFSLCGVRMFGEDVPCAFGSLTTAVFTLIKCITLSGWAKNYSAFKDEHPTIAIFGLVYFISFVFLCAFIFLNLFNSVIMNIQEIAETTESKSSEDDKPLKKLIHVNEVMRKTNMTRQHTSYHDTCLTNLTLKSFEESVMLKDAYGNVQGQEELLQELERIVEETRNLSINKRRERRAQKQRQIATSIIENLLKD